MKPESDGERWYPYLEKERHVEHIVNRIEAKRLEVDMYEDNMAAKLKKKKDDLARYCEIWIPAMQDYYDRNPPSKGKSIHLDNGRIGFRTVKGGARVVDVATCLEWAQENFEAALDEQPPKLKKKIVYDYVKATGEIPPGVDLVDDEERFYVKGK